jgi:hypothetical protein
MNISHFLLRCLSQVLVPLSSDRPAPKHPPRLVEVAVRPPPTPQGADTHFVPRHILVGALLIVLLIFGFCVESSDDCLPRIFLTFSFVAFCRCFFPSPGTALPHNTLRVWQGSRYALPQPPKVQRLTLALGTFWYVLC